MDLDRKQLLSIGINPNRHRTLGATLGALASFIVLLLAASSASAATLNVSGGQLLGASGVVVGGNAYDVDFLDGTCIALYSGCDAVADFTFQSQAAALLASQALLDQVFLDGANLFDTDPELTFGCTDAGLCRAITPYLLSGGGVFVAIAANVAGVAGDTTGSSALNTTDDTALVADVVYAVWTPVPEPGTGILMGLGLIALGRRNRAARYKRGRCGLPQSALEPRLLFGAVLEE